MDEFKKKKKSDIIIKKFTEIIAKIVILHWAFKTTAGTNIIKNELSSLLITSDKTALFNIRV